MSDHVCPKCGAGASPEDQFCRECGAALDGAEQSPVEGQTASQASQNDYWSSQPAAPKRTARRGCCLLSAAAAVFFLFSLCAALLIFFASQPGGLAAVKIEVPGPATLYPTHTPYRTATPYRTSTIYPTSTTYPTRAPYPTTGPLQRPSPTGFASLSYIGLGGCKVNVNNQNMEQDAVVLLSSVDKGLIVISMYVRAGEAFSGSSIPTGSYTIFVTLGKNWDSFTGKFNQNVYYFRFEEPTVFTTCTSGLYGSYQYVDITLSLKEGPGSNTISVAPDSFPKLGH